MTYRELEIFKAAIAEFIYDKMNAIYEKLNISEDFIEGFNEALEKVLEFIESY
jgi:hypothetical protein